MSSNLFKNQFTIFQKIKSKIRTRKNRLRDNVIVDSNWDGKQKSDGFQNWVNVFDIQQYENVWDPFVFDVKNLELQKKKRNPKIDPRYYLEAYEHWYKVRSNAGKKYRLSYNDEMKEKNFKEELNKQKRLNDKRSNSLQQTITQDQYLENQQPNIRRNFANIMRDDEQRDFLIKQGVMFDSFSSDSDKEFQNVKNGIKIKEKSHSLSVAGMKQIPGLYSKDGTKKRIRPSFAEKLLRRKQGNNLLKYEIQKHEKSQHSFASLMQSKKVSQRNKSCDFDNQQDSDSDYNPFKDDQILVEIGKRVKDLTGYDSIFGKKQSSITQKMDTQYNIQAENKYDEQKRKSEEFQQNIYDYNKKVPIYDPIKKQFSIQGQMTGITIPEQKTKKSTIKRVTSNSVTTLSGNSTKKTRYYGRFAQLPSQSILVKGAKQILNNIQINNKNQENRSLSMDVAKLCNSRSTFQAELCSMNNPLMIYDERNQIMDETKNYKALKKFQQNDFTKEQYEPERMGYQSQYNDLYSVDQLENKKLKKIIQDMVQQMKGNQQFLSQKRKREKSVGKSKPIDLSAYYKNYEKDFPNITDQPQIDKNSSIIGNWNQQIFNPSSINNSNSHILVNQSLPTYEQLRNYNMEKLAFQVEKKQFENDQLEYEKLKLQYEISNKNNQKLKKEVALLKYKCGIKLSDFEQKIVDAAKQYLKQKKDKNNEEVQKNVISSTDIERKYSHEDLDNHSIDKISEKEFELEESYLEDNDTNNLADVSENNNSKSKLDSSSFTKNQNISLQKDIEIDWLSRSRKQKQENQERLGIESNEGKDSEEVQQLENINKSIENLNDITQCSQMRKGSENSVIPQVLQKSLGQEKESNITALDKLKQLNCQQIKQNSPLFTIVKRNGKQLLSIQKTVSAPNNSNFFASLMDEGNEAQEGIENIQSQCHKSMSQILQQEEQRILQQEQKEKLEQKAAHRKKVQLEQIKKVQDIQASLHKSKLWHDEQEWQAPVLSQAEKDEICFDMLALEEERFKKLTQKEKLIENYGIIRENHLKVFQKEKKNSEEIITQQRKNKFCDQKIN